MRTAALLAALVFIPRIGVAEVGGNRDDIRHCLETTAAAASSENLDAYVECFETRIRSQVRKTAGLRFAQFEVGVSIEDCHVLSCDKTTCDVAVRYTMHLSDRSFNYLSVLTMKHLDGTWKIRKETIREWQETTVAESPCPYGGGSVSTASTRSSCSSSSCSLSGH